MIPRRWISRTLPFALLLASLSTGCLFLEDSSNKYPREEDPVLYALLLSPAIALTNSGGSSGTTTTTTPQRYIIFQAGGSTATMTVDLSDLSTIASGPTSTGVFNTNNSASLISGGTRSGHYWLTGSGSNSYFFDPSTQTFANGPALDVGYGNNANAWVVSSGAQANKIYIRFGQGWSGTDRYNPTTDLNEGSSFASTGGSGLAGSHSFLIPSGPEAGKHMLIIGNITNSELYDPAADGFAADSAIGATPGQGSHSMALDNGTFLIPAGGGSAATRLYDPSSNSFAAGGGLACGCTAGCHSTRISSGTNAGKFLFVCGGGSFTQIYDQTGATFSAGPNLTGSANNGAQTFAVTAGTDAGKLWIIHGGGTNSTSYYDPETNIMSSGPTLPIFPGGVLRVPLP